MAVVVSPPPPKTDGKFDDWMYLFWKKVVSAVSSVTGIPAGGSAGTVLRKIDGTDYNVEWGYPVLGYLSTEGAGGIVYQSVDKSTSVTLDTKCGTIVMQNSTLLDSTTVSFTLYNTYIESTDVVALTIQNGNGAGMGSYLTQVEYTNTGQCSIALRNISGGSISDYVYLNFAIIKAYNS